MAQPEAECSTRLTSIAEPSNTGSRSRYVAGACLLAMLPVIACAPRVAVSLPGGAGRPSTEAETISSSLTARCDSVQTWSAEMSVAGRVRGRTVRARVLAGTARQGDLRLEGVAPFGSPLFLLVASNERASLLFPRERSLLRDAAVEQVLDAMIGLPLTASDLHAVLTGCVTSRRAPSGGREYDGGWLAVDLGEMRTAFLRRTQEAWRIEAARIGGLSVGYGAFDGLSPREIRLVIAQGGGDGAVQLQVKLAQVEENPSLPSEAFTLETPSDTLPLSLEELRARGLRLDSGGE